MVEVIKSVFFMVGVSELWIYTFLDRCVVNSYVACVVKKGVEWPQKSGQLVIDQFQWIAKAVTDRVVFDH